MALHKQQSFISPYASSSSSISKIEKDSEKIQRLSQKVSQKICTDQIIITLAGACRELIDNALDAGATNIEIRAKENGTEILEVLDNGSGVMFEDFYQLCRPHSTSKLIAIDDFNSLESYGFRGEALNALAALSDLQITTRHSESRCAWRLHYDRNGNIIKQEQCSRPQGTTVSIYQLFKTLPVRRQELIRSVRREFLKLVETIQAFALSRPDIRFTCSNIVNSKRVQVLASPGGPSTTLPEVIASLFCVKIGKNGLLQLEEASPSQEIEQIYNITTSKNSTLTEAIYRQIRLSGYVSSCEPGQGRGGADRQFIFVNRRHVDYPKLCRIANELYKIYNRNQYCTLVLFVDIPSATLDVNICPDKRTVFVHHEKELFAKLRASILATFAKVESACPIDVLQLDSRIDRYSGFNNSPITSYNALSNLPSKNEYDHESQSGSPKNTPKRTFARRCSQSDGIQGGISAIKSLEAYSFKNHRKGGVGTALLHTNHIEQRTAKRPSREQGTDWPTQQILPKTPIRREEFINDITNEHSDQQPSPSPSSAINSSPPPPIIVESTSSPSNSSSIGRPHQPIPINMAEMERRFTAFKRKRKIAQFDADDGKKNNGKDIRMKQPQIEEADLDFDEQNADLAKLEIERKLSLMLSKTHFSAMHLIGQFNNAFLLTRLGPQLFMIDQHAADEKFNFEWLQAQATVKSQKLIEAQPLQLGSVNEALLMDNLELFQKNGFEFRIEGKKEEEEEGEEIMLLNGVDEDDDDGSQASMSTMPASTTPTVLLTATPNIKGYNFDKHDIDQLLLLVGEMPGQLHRPNKIRAIFASKACRKSVMFGQALTEQKMHEIIQNMGKMEAPWNCPHGRPTIRHLCTINNITT